MESIIPTGKRQHNSTQSTTLLSILKITIFILSSYFLIYSGFIYTLLGEGRGTFNNAIRSGRRLINNDKINESPSTENELPLCVGKLLDKRHYRYESSSRLLMTKLGRSCRLLNYTAEKIVHCFDALRHQHDQAGTPFRLIFMGDSIVRQQYLNFVRLIPDYDKLLQPSNAELLFHGNMEVTSASLRLRLSFRWQPYVDDDVVNKVRQWAVSASAYDNVTRPASSLLLLSMALWHIIEVDYRDHRLYNKHLRELAPSLAQLSQVTRVIWLNQYPPLEFYSDYTITPEKINFYNKAVRRILLPEHAGSSNSSRVEIWDSGNPLVEEYVRSCVIHRRYEGRKTSSKTSPGLLALKYYSGAYSNCMDHVHIGYSALSQITQLLYNDICNPISQMLL